MPRLGEGPERDLEDVTGFLWPPWHSTLLSIRPIHGFLRVLGTDWGEGLAKKLFSKMLRARNVVALHVRPHSYTSSVQQITGTDAFQESLF
jgi:hypothetical protein